MNAATLSTGIVRTHLLSSSHCNFHRAGFFPIPYGLIFKFFISHSLVLSPGNQSVLIRSFDTSYPPVAPTDVNAGSTCGWCQWQGHGDAGQDASGGESNRPAPPEHAIQGGLRYEESGKETTHTTAQQSSLTEQCRPTRYPPIHPFFYTEHTQLESRGHAISFIFVECLDPISGMHRCLGLAKLGRHPWLTLMVVQGAINCNMTLTHVCAKRPTSARKGGEGSTPFWTMQAVGFTFTNKVS